MKSFLIALLFTSALCAQCPVTATVNPNGTITLNSTGITILNECHDYLNNCFVNTLYHVKCNSIALEYVLMATDQGKVYHFQLPYQNSSYFAQWCGQTNFAQWYQQIKYDPNWQHPLYNIRCTTTLSNGHQCSRFSELDYCWQHR